MDVIAPACLMAEGLKPDSSAGVEVRARQMMRLAPSCRATYIHLHVEWGLR
jgi:hypothetical protein